MRACVMQRRVAGRRSANKVKPMHGAREHALHSQQETLPVKLRRMSPFADVATPLEIAARLIKGAARAALLGRQRKSKETKCGWRGG